MTKEEPNGWTKTLVGFLWAVIFTAMVTLTNNVIANDKRQTDSVDKVKSEVNDLKIVVAETKTKLQSIDDNLKEIKMILRRHN